MKPRSLVFTLYGDYLRYCGAGEAPLGAIVELLSLFGVESTTTRRVMSRLRAEGWFTTRREGRQVSYLLAEDGWRLMDEGRERIFRHESGQWSGEWTLVLVRTSGGSRIARERLRTDLDWHGFGSLLPGTWLAPRDRRDVLERTLERHSEVDGEVFLVSKGDLEADRELASRCWDLPHIDESYARFVMAHVDDVRDAEELDDGGALRLRTTLTDDYRRFPFADPDLPRALLPAAWSGWRAHELFVEVHDALRGRAERELGRIVGLPVVNAHTVRLDDGRVTFH